MYNSSGEECTAESAKEITCKVVTLSNIGTYKLDGTTSISSPSASIGTTSTTVSSAAAGGGEGETNGTSNTNLTGNYNPNGNKFLRVSSILLLLIAFLL
jgi:hypothetical protein